MYKIQYDTLIESGRHDRGCSKQNKHNAFGRNINSHKNTQREEKEEIMCMRMCKRERERERERREEKRREKTEREYKCYLERREESARGGMTLSSLNQK